MYKLNQFVDLQNDIYSQAVLELKNGYKKTNWIHLIFPRLILDKSDENIFFHLKNSQEARVFMAHSILGSRLKECLNILLNIENKTVLNIFGSPDFLHFKSSMTLFAMINEDENSIFHKILDKYYSGKMDIKTIQILKEETETPISGHLAWLQELQNNHNDYKKINELRITIYKDTQLISNNGKYQLEKKTIFFQKPEEIAKSVKYYLQAKKIQTLVKNYSTQIFVIPSNEIEQANILESTGCHPTIHVETNRIFPGNEANEGQESIEADLFRRSNITPALYQFTDDADIFQIERNPDFSYPFPKDFTGGIYSPNISIFRGKEINGYGLLKNPFMLDFIFTSHSENPEIELVQGEWRFSIKSKDIILEKIRTVLRIAFIHQHDSIIFGINHSERNSYPTKHLAELYGQVLFESEFKDVFKLIIFSIASPTIFQNSIKVLDGIYSDFYTTFYQ
ncbi:MAG: DUF1810 family protein [Chitinophagales bacterium]|nr:DUF1810 family protein [Chitinophagales bacterium]MCZ2394050.1 DUF1810 family protein [Chitinophagales bacterium]